MDKPILYYYENNCFLEIRKTTIDNYETFEILLYDYFDKNIYQRIAYWELTDYYKFIMSGNSFLNVDNGILCKYMRIGQKILDCYLGEIRRMDIM